MVGVRWMWSSSIIEEGNNKLSYYSSAELWI